MNRPFSKIFLFTAGMLTESCIAMESVVERATDNQKVVTATSDETDNSFEKKLVALVREYTQSSIKEECYTDLEALARPIRMRVLPIDNAVLFEDFPAFAFLFPYKTLNAGSTPSILRDDSIENLIGPNNFYIYYNSSASKLEFLFGEALAHNCPAIMSFGAPGSEHLIQVAVWAQLLRLQAICMMHGEEEYPHRDKAYVREVLKRHLKATSTLRYSSSSALHKVAVVDEFARAKRSTGFFPFLVPAGGSNALGFLGLINRMLCVKKMISRGEIPEPDFIVSRIGANAAGLLFGKIAAGLSGRFLVFETRSGLFNHVKDRFRWINGLFKQALPNWIEYYLTTEDEKNDEVTNRYRVITEKDFEVIEYGTSDYEAEARELQTKTCFENKPLYYLRYLAALADYIKRNKIQGKKILFLDYYQDPGWIPDNLVDWRSLPKELHFYFENE